MSQDFFTQRVAAFFLSTFLLTLANIKLVNEMSFLKSSLILRQIVLSLLYGSLRMQFPDLPLGLQSWIMIETGLLQKMFIVGTDAFAQLLAVLCTDVFKL